MPNHETNTVVIVGEPEKIRAFVNEGTREIGPDENRVGEEYPERVIDFRLIVPEPANIERGGCSGQHDAGVVCWYEWNLSNWGTKWNAYSHSHYALRILQEWGEVAPYGRVDLRFETAWSQPKPIFEAIEKRWGVEVHAVTQDEGGYPDVTYEFETWDKDVTKQAKP